jgi:hypothetical protein
MDKKSYEDLVQEDGILHYCQVIVLNVKNSYSKKVSIMVLLFQETVQFQNVI